MYVKLTNKQIDCQSKGKINLYPLPVLDMDRKNNILKTVTEVLNFEICLTESDGTLEQDLTSEKNKILYILSLYSQSELWTFNIKNSKETLCSIMSATQVDKESNIWQLFSPLCHKKHKFPPYHPKVNSPVQ